MDAFKGMNAYRQKLMILPRKKKVSEALKHKHDATTLYLKI